MQPRSLLLVAARLLRVIQRDFPLHEMRDRWRLRTCDLQRLTPAVVARPDTHAVPFRTPPFVLVHDRNVDERTSRDDKHDPALQGSRHSLGRHDYLACLQLNGYSVIRVDDENEALDPMKSHRSCGRAGLHDRGLRRAAEVGGVPSRRRPRRSRRLERPHETRGPVEERKGLGRRQPGWARELPVWNQRPRPDRRAEHDERPQDTRICVGAGDQ